MPQILCVACFLSIFQLDWSNTLLVILISDYGLLLEKTIGWFSNTTQKLLKVNHNIYKKKTLEKL